MKYLSVCSGMEAATVAWHHLGWQPVGFSEIEPFPSAILKHHYPTIPNYGDLTKYKQWPLEPGTIDLLVGGTPCQAFSVAGLRKGLADPRGNLALVFLGLADKLKPRWIVWENVPGVLSSSGGRDFGSFLGALVELGYGFAYRVLDAQHFGVPQRRRRVFVVACLGEWQSPAKVLFEPECVCRDIKKSRKKGQGVASSVENSVGAGLPIWRAGDQANAEHMIDHAGTVSCNKGSHGGFIAKQVTYYMNQHHNPQPSDNVHLTTKNCASVRGDTPLVQPNNVAQPPGMAVRRLTPKECERLQGFSDNWSQIPWKRKPAEQCPDGPRYKACGNSMAVPVMSWIGERIQKHIDGKLLITIKPQPK